MYNLSADTFYKLGQCVSSQSQNTHDIKINIEEYIQYLCMYRVGSQTLKWNFI
jgi:hypothetical protein